MERRKKERDKIYLKEKLLNECEYYLKEYPEAKKFIFLSDSHLQNKLSIRDYLNALLESYDLSKLNKWENSKLFNQDLENKANEFIEFTRLSSKIYELEEVEKLSLNNVYGIFFDSLNFYREHNLFFKQFSKMINEYIDTHCQGEVAHRVVGRCTQQWLSCAEYSDELVNKFKEFNLSLSCNFKKIMNNNIEALSIEEKEYIKAKCLDEIFLDKIICTLFNEGYLSDVSLDKIQLNGNRKIRNMASQIESSRYYYTSLQSISANEFVPNTWF